MRYLLLPALLLCAGCTTTKLTLPPSVSTAQVIEALSNTKQVLKEAGDQNTVVAQKIDKALTLAERLDALLEQIETTYNNKNIVKPE
jgi:primosomal protein N'